VSYENGKVSISVEINLNIGIVEMRGQEVGSDAQRRELTERVQEVLERRIREVFEKVQQKPGCDIFGYGNLIYMNDYALWEEIGDNWDSLFQNAQFEAKVNVVITHAGLMTR
jgi:spore germination protein KC